MLIVAACLQSAACGGQPAGAPDAAGPKPEEAETAEAHRLANGTEPLAGRASVIALAQSVEALAVREGAGARAVDLHTVAARLLERVWRAEGHDQDAKEAVDLYRAGGRELGIAGACEAAVRGATLSGELARDATSTYVELYRVQRRMAGEEARPLRDSTRDASAVSPGASACARSIDDSLALLSAFRPAAHVLEAIDQGLAGEGMLPAALGQVAPSVRVADAPQIARIEDWPGKDAARVVLVLSRPARFRVGDEPGTTGVAPRTYVELDGVDVGSVPREVRMSGIVSRVLASATTTGARVTLELQGQAFRRVFYLPEPYRVVIDVAQHPPGAAAGRGRRIVARVVLDPGHGGNDPGAIGPTGVKEKDLTLDVAARAAPLLMKDGIEVLVTRSEDRFVTLEERTARANEFMADLFVSIHGNAAENRTRHGVETYVLDTTKDEIAARVAARENATSQAATAELGSILANMRLADQASRSTRFAGLLDRAVLGSLRDAYPDVHDGGVHPAGFYVLVGARMPSVLLETGYLSNAVEEQRLGSDDYRQRLADAVVNAVKAYREGR